MWPHASPDLTSTFRGTERSMAAGMRVVTRPVISSISPGATSKISSSCTWMHMRGPEAAVRHVLVDIDHGDLGDVGGGALNRHVDRHALGCGSVEASARTDVRQLAPPAGQCLGVALAPRFFFHRIDVVPDSRVLAEVEFDELLSLRAGQIGLHGHTVCAEAVDDAEIQDLGDAALLRRHLVRVIHGPRRCVVDVLASPECRQQAWLA